MTRVTALWILVTFFAVAQVALIVWLNGKDKRKKKADLIEQEFLKMGGENE